MICYNFLESGVENIRTHSNHWQKTNDAIVRYNRVFFFTEDCKIPDKKVKVGLAFPFLLGILQSATLKVKKNTLYHSPAIRESHFIIFLPAPLSPIENYILSTVPNVFRFVILFYALSEAL